MNIGAGLMAGANFASGYQQGQQQRLQQNMQQLAFQNAQLQEQQNALNMKRAQAEADYSMSLFTTGIKDPVTGQTIGGNDISPQQYSQAMGRFAATNRDPAGAMQYFTQGANFQSNQEQQQLRAAQVQAANAKRHAQQAKDGADLAAALPDSPQSLQQWKAQMIAEHPDLTPEERQNIASIQYQPGVLDRIAHTGMSAYQQFQLKDAQAKAQQEAAHQQQQNQLARARLQEQQRHDQVVESQKKNGGDKPFPHPTPAMTDQAYAALGQAIGQGVDSNGQFKDAQFNSAAQDIAEQAAALAQRNPALTYRDAMNQIIQSYKASGMLTQAPNAPGILDKAADLVGIHTNPGTS
ncbi:MAG TPA: hypothetical protein V6C65_26575, partial [Allocoleopsis sp.]